jgi:hypothetical protein
MVKYPLYETKADFYYYSEETGDNEIPMMIEFDYQPAQRGSYWEPGYGAYLRVMEVRRADGKPIDFATTKEIESWAQEHLDDNVDYIVEKEIRG